MPFITAPTVLPHVNEAARILGLTQETLGSRLGVSRRTVSRWMAGRSGVSPRVAWELARAVHPLDVALAAKLAAEGGETLESLGLARPAPPPAPPGPPPRPSPPLRIVVDAVVCVAAETLQASPTTVREALKAAFARARLLGLTVEEVDDALSPPPAPPGGTGTVAGEATARTKARSTSAR